MVILKKLNRCIRSHTCADHRERLLNVQRIDNGASLAGPAEEAGALQLTAGIAMTHKVKGGRGNPMNPKLFPEQTAMSAIGIAGTVQQQNPRGRALWYKVTAECASSSINLEKTLSGKFIHSKFDSTESFDPELTTERLVAEFGSFVLKSIKRSVINFG